MFITATNKFYVRFFCPLVTHINVSRYIHTRHVAYMHRAIGIGQGCCNEVSPEAPIP